jgi:hypothetical protein
MYCHLFLLFIGLIMAGGSGSGTIGADSASVDKCSKAIGADLEQAGAEFRRLRSIAGHFGGGLWNDDVDKWMGKKHRLMIELESLIVEGNYERTCVIQLLGSPDQMVSEGHRLYPAIIDVLDDDKPKVASDEYLVYYWRAEHDFLFFTCRDAKVINSGWWYAGD